MTVPAQIKQQLQTQKILILGLGREGLSTYKFLRKLFPKKTLNIADTKPLNQLPAATQAFIKQDQKVNLYLKNNHLNHLTTYQLIFKSPGVNPNCSEIKNAKKQGILFSSNTILLYQIIKQFKQNNQLISIAVTGTKGKSTTANFIYQVLKQAQKPALLAGNIGKPPLEIWPKIQQNSLVVLELSCHQLADFKAYPNLAADIAVVQEITSEHLDYYQKPAAYIEAKTPIAAKQKVNQYIIYNPKFAKTRQVARQSKAQVLTYSLEPNSDAQVYLKSHYLTFRYGQNWPKKTSQQSLKDLTNNSSPANNPLKEEKIIKQDQIPLLGKHNLYNLMPAVIIAKLFGISNQTIKQTIQNLKPLPHRLQLVANKNGVKYYNDSLATTPEATIWALSSFAEQPIILLAGGHERHQNFSQLAIKILQKNVMHLVLFDPTGQRLWATIKTTAKKLGINKLPTHVFAKTMAQAVKSAQTKAAELIQLQQKPTQAKPTQSGQPIILLSPAAASFGLFKNYADRGDQFEKAV